MLPNNLIILGGGASINEGIENGLFDLLPNTFSIGLNYAYKFVKTTLNMGVDEKFYNDNHTELSELPLYIGKENYALTNRGKNCIFLPSCKDYYRGCEPGVYSSTLVGLFSLSLFIALMDVGNIFILGMDYGPLRDKEGTILKNEKGEYITHFYQGEILHRGINKINWYTSTVMDKPTGKRISNAEREYKVYKDETKVNIYNVSLNSAINVFPKISYEEFFSKKLITGLNQDDIRLEIRKKIRELQGRMAHFKQNPPIYVPKNININNTKGSFDIKG